MGMRRLQMLIQKQTSGEDDGLRASLVAIPRERERRSGIRTQRGNVSGRKPVLNFLPLHEWAHPLTGERRHPPSRTVALGATGVRSTAILTLSPHGRRLPPAPILR